MATANISCTAPGCKQPADTLCSGCAHARCNKHLVFCYHAECDVAQCIDGECSFEKCTECEVTGCMAHMHLCECCEGTLCETHLMECEDCTAPMHPACSEDGLCVGCIDQRSEFSEAEEATDEDAPPVPDPQPE